MKFIVLCFIGVAVLASPCAYDSDPSEPNAVVTIIAQISSLARSIDVADAGIPSQSADQAARSSNN
jgi:hypothetical protein